MSSNARKSLRQQLNETRDEKFDNLAYFVSTRRRIKPILRRLRNKRIHTISLCQASWSTKYSSIAFIYLSQRVKSMKDCMPMLEFIDNLPGNPENDSSGWDTHDSPTAGTRTFQRTVIHNEVLVQIELTAIPDDKSPEAKCRRVVVGQKERTETRTEPVYEIVCDE
jgi:hypothetical protein